jgi:hypothetical protein
MTATQSAAPTIHHVAIERAIKLLNAAKAPFAIQMPDGAFIGELPVVIEKPKKPKKKINDWMAEFPGYSQIIEALEVGDSYSWDAGDLDKAKAFRSTVSSKGIHAHGNESCMTALRDGRHVDILRMA